MLRVVAVTRRWPVELISPEHRPLGKAGRAAVLADDLTINRQPRHAVRLAIAAHEVADDVVTATLERHSGDNPLHDLARLTGTLHVDGYAFYRTLAEKGEVKLAICWSHVCRKFYELAAAGPAPIATEALERIAALYRIEPEIRGHSAKARRLVRQDRTRPLLDALEAFLREKLTLISQKTKLAEAIRYALSRWEGLSRFVYDGRVELDSAMRSIVATTTWSSARSVRSP